MVVGGEHGRFPDLPLLDFAVAEQREDAALGAAVALLVNAHAERDARGNREPLAKRSGRDLDTGKLLGIGVALQTAVQLAQRKQFVFGNITKLGKRGVEHGRRMALRENEVIAFGMLRIGFGIVHHAAKIERGDDVRGGKRSARMTATGLFKHLDDVFAHVVRTRLDLVYGFLNHAKTSISRSRLLGHSP